MQMVMTPDETQIQILANWPMSHAKRVTRDNWKNPEYRVIAAIRKLRTDKLSRRKIMAKPCKKWAAYRIWKDLRPQKYWTAEYNDAKDRERKCCLFTAFSFAILCIIIFCCQNNESSPKADPLTDHPFFQNLLSPSFRTLVLYQLPCCEESSPLNVSHQYGSTNDTDITHNPLHWHCAWWSCRRVDEIQN